jgi:predicted XRE-type DNA-binding protein
MNSRIVNTPDSSILSGNPEADTLYMKELLIVAGLKQTDVARALGVKKTIVNRVILRKDNSARVLAYFEDLAKQYGEKLQRLRVIVKE